MQTKASARGRVVELNVAACGKLGCISDVAGCELTPDEALALAAALERAAFMQRRAASIGPQRAEAEANAYAAKYAAKGKALAESGPVKARGGLLSGAYWTESNPAKG